MNNSSPQGWLFDAQISSTLHHSLGVNAVQTCDSAEAVAGHHAVAPDGSNGFDAIVFDMSDRNNPNNCRQLH